MMGDSPSSLPSTQSAVFYTVHGAKEAVISFKEDAPVPVLIPGHVMLKVHAAAWNPVDGSIANGYLKKPFTPEKIQEILGPLLG